MDRAKKILDTKSSDEINLKNQDVSSLLLAVEEQCNEFKYDKAYKILRELEPIIQKTTDTEDVYKYHLLSGICEYEKHEFTLAIEHFFNCLQVIDNYSSDNKIIIRKTVPLHELSLCYFGRFQQTKQANGLQLSIDYCQQALNEGIDCAMVKKRTGFMEYAIETPENYLSELVHLATLYQEKGDFYKSNAILEVAMICCKRHYKWRTLGVVYDELGSNNRCTGKFGRALYFYGKALHVKSFIGNEIGLDVTNNNIFKCFMKIKSEKPELLNSPTQFQHILEEESL